MSIKLPFAPSKAAQAVVAILTTVGAVGTTLLHDLGGVLPASWAAAITSGLAVIAGVAGFIRKAEPLIGDLDQFTS
ncbi:hypothetical protein BMW24_003380 [Mycobacterium heckeshornense]|uniref:hypothetical protein n=1 Tax=Mycobacterium heckeshornense TaxID=110505 RepID=UPI0008FD09A8|nr:hypothetical protein [Mycobacterium heckeshornense]PIJ36722.1 hypothetical protein BMW24_003095 [Mycobacterium heckeshornense]PIJ36773.1 hypothetical protein BMW24_003380 [Mycobacterium heckeshornense]